jgi:dolichol kinase
MNKMFVLQAWGPELRLVRDCLKNTRWKTSKKMYREREREREREKHKHTYIFIYIIKLLLFKSTEFAKTEKAQL